ncbi:hypothetical protein ACIQ6R_06225 [Streptomyces sp. NPDC096048]|uniref:hypothetical protein n=1 Tax=Streptomyces sp. NPDC096048 TaxID=3366072 RepID=UPI00382D8F56
MTDRPYTDDDLRTEAARQHASLTADPDYVGVGEQMEDRHIQSTVIDEDPDFAPEGATWAGALDPEGDGTDVYAEAQRKIHTLINGAANVSEWAVNLGADGLEPSPDVINLDGANGPFVRIHFAFDPAMPVRDRQRFGLALAQAIADNT